MALWKRGMTKYWVSTTLNIHIEAKFSFNMMSEEELPVRIDGELTKIPDYTVVRVPDCERWEVDQSITHACRVERMEDSWQAGS